MASNKTSEELWTLFVQEVARTGTSGLVPNDARWKGIEARFLRAMRHPRFRYPGRDPKPYVLEQPEGDDNGDKQRVEKLVWNVLSRRPDIALEIVTLITSEPRLIKTYWLPQILEIVSFAEYGMEIPRITRQYLKFLMTREPLRELMTQLQERDGSTCEARSDTNRAAESEAGVTLVEVHKKLTEVSAYTIENFHAYLCTIFRNNLLKAVNHDDTNLSVGRDEETEWARKLRRRKKQSLYELQESGEDKVDAVLNHLSPPSPDQTIIASGSDLLELIPAGRLRKVAVLRFVEDLTQAEVAKELNVTERTVRTDEEKIKTLVRKKVNP